MNPKKIILNTDIGGDFDDFLALAMCLSSPEIDLLGVVTTKEDIREKAVLARVLVDLAGRKDLPIFYNGCLKKKGGSYMQTHEYAEVLRSETIREGHTNPEISSEGIEFIRHQVRENPHQVTFVSIAPNTNLASAITENGIADKIKDIYLMGGHHEHTQINRNKPEHNYLRDRSSFYKVLECGAPTHMLPRDVTLDLFMNPSILKERAKKDRFHQILWMMGEKFLERMERESFRLSDAITLTAVLAPQLFYEQKVKIERIRGTQGESFYCIPESNSNITAVYDFDREKVHDLIISRV